MKAIIRTSAILVVSATFALAEAPKPQSVVILDNENLLEGEVTQIPEGYRVRRLVGGELILPRTRVLAVVADRKAAFATIADRANRRDADERLRLARWCMEYDLPTEALNEAKAALKLRPGFAIAERLVARLEELAAAPRPAPGIVQARADVPAAESVADVPIVEYNSQSFPLFASRVNTILLNMCASCHARDDAKSFRLTRAGGRSAVTRNLLAALPHVNPREPESSVLLARSVAPHGGALQAPFKTKEHPAYQTLETWARFARAPEGTLEPEDDPVRPEPRKLPEAVAGEAVKGEATRTGERFGQDAGTADAAKGTRDPFDPAIFNGEKKKNAP